MGEPAFVQFPFVGGLDEKTAATYLDPEANQAGILNGSFRYVGRVDKRYGIQADRELSSTILLNPNGITDPYVAPSSYATSLGGLGDIILQGAWAWIEKGAVSSYAGKLSNVTATRRPLPARPLALPLLCDGVVSLQGTVRAMAWIAAPQSPIGTSTFLVDSALLSPTTSERLSSFPTLNIVNATNVTLVSLMWLPNTGTLALFVVVEAAASSARELRAYTVTPANNSNVWTLQAGATLALRNDDATCLDVQPMVGDPNDGYIVLYLPAAASTTLNWRYFKAFASTASGALAVGTSPGLFPMHVVADWGIDVALVWSDNPGGAGTDRLHVDYLSADGLFTALATYNVAPSGDANYGPYAYAQWQLGGACRVYEKTNATLNSQIYISFWAQDTNDFSQGGPSMPVAMGGLVARSTVNVVTPLGFVNYPYGLRPLARPSQMNDSLQIIGQFVHVAHPCVQDFMLFSGASVPIANINATNPTCEQVTEYLVDFRCRAQVGVPLAIASSQATIVATVAPRQLDPYLERWSDGRFLQPSGSADLTKVLTPIALVGSGLAGIGADQAVMWLAEFSAAQQPSTTLINGTMEVSGGVLMRAGEPIVEHGFVHFPEFLSVTTAGAGITGTYSYAVVYARQDRHGNIERSSPAILATPIALANQSALLVFPKLSWTNDTGTNPITGYFIEVYRTLTLGSTYYCLARIDPGNLAAGPYGSYQDNTTDAVLQKASILYTTGGVLDTVNPPAARLLCTHRGRLALVDETLSNVWFSQSETSGEVMGFNEELIQPFIEGGDITAIASLDDKFAAFKAASIYVMYGDGPADTGQGSDWTQPQRVPSDVGCVSAASVVTVPQGIVFLSAIGFHLLGRDLQVAYIGKGVQDTVKTYATCVSSCLVPTAKQARWVMQDANGNQRIICFDYFLNVWTVHQYANLDGPIAQIFLDDASVYTVITSVGGRYKESISSFLDTDMAAASHFVPLSVTSPWIKVSGPQSYMNARSVLVYGEAQDAAGLQVQLCYNYNQAARKTAMWTYARLESRPTEQVEVHSPAAYCKCESVQVVLTDVDDAAKTTGQGFTFDAIALDLVKIGDRYRRLPARLRA